uniref:Ig-like domain-containing protein n=1 Tax=Panagrolaimus sp. JU765 TaxID=591449 RepID=A0AC34Q8B2_9BILA
MNYFCFSIIFLLACLWQNVFLLTFEDLLKSQKCKTQGNTSLSCKNLTKDEISQLFLKLNSTSFSENLQILSVTNSQLSTIVNLPKLNSLKKLDLSKNQIQELSNPQQIAFRNVVHFDISANSLRLLPHDSFSFFPNLEEIHLENNKIMSIDWEAFRLFKLKSLHLQNNYLPVISEHMLRFTPNLENLDLSHNQLTIVQSSSFFNAQRLSAVNLSFNRIQQFKYDSFATLDQVKWLDLSYNNISTIPGLDLKQIIGLQSLNLSGNPFDKLVVGDVSLPMLEELEINDCQKLKLVEAETFSTLPKLKRLSMSNNPNLTFISPNAFGNISKLNEIKMVNNSFQNIEKRIFEASKIISISGNPLKCSCISSVLTKYSKIIQDYDKINCQSLPPKCPSEPFLPFGDILTANLGSCFSIYCASTTFSSTIFWSLPNGSRIIGNHSEESWKTKMVKNPVFLPFLSNVDTKNGQDGMNNVAENSPRVTSTPEQLNFDAVLPEDVGIYKCSTGESAKSREIKLNVRTPAIKINAVEVGSHFATVSWNDSLKICAYNKVNSFLTVQDADGVTRRYTRLSLHNPWLSYNVMRLKPLQNYSICLLYLLVDGGQNRKIFQTCTFITTKDSASFWNSFNITAVLVILAIPLSVWIIVLIRTIYFKLHIWHDTTIRSKMNQSISGQSFLSRSSSAHGYAFSPSSTYGNGFERAGQSTRMSVLGPLVEESDNLPLEFENNAAV